MKKLGQSGSFSDNDKRTLGKRGKALYIVTAKKAWDKTKKWKQSETGRNERWAERKLWWNCILILKSLGPAVLSLILWSAPSSFPVIWANQVYFFLSLFKWICHIQSSILTKNLLLTVANLSLHKKWLCTELITVERQGTIRRRKEEKALNLDIRFLVKKISTLAHLATGNSLIVNSR